MALSKWLYTSPVFLSSSSVLLSSSSSMSMTATETNSRSTQRWNMYVRQAENLVGLPANPMRLRSRLLTAEGSALSQHLPKLLSSPHPVTTAIKDILYQGDRNHIQVRGLVMLLLSRCFYPYFAHLSETDHESRVMERQRKLSEFVETIFAAQSIHRSVLNLPQQEGKERRSEELEPEVQEEMALLEFGNKLAILGGDYLLAHACTGSAQLRNTRVVELISLGIADFTQAEFIGQRDNQRFARFVPDNTTVSTQSWFERSRLAHGNLMANGCQSTLILADVDEHMLASRIGLHFSLALQAALELEPFAVSQRSDGVVKIGALDLSFAPVLFHLQNDAQLLKHINECQENLDELLDYKKVYEEVIKGPGIEMTRQLCESHVNEALKEVDQIDDSDAKQVLRNLLMNINH